MFVFCLHQKNSHHGQESNLWPHQPQQQIVLLLSNRCGSEPLAVATRLSLVLFFSHLIAYRHVSVTAKRSLLKGHTLCHRIFALSIALAGCMCASSSHSVEGAAPLAEHVYLAATQRWY